MSSPACNFSWCYRSDYRVESPRPLAKKLHTGSILSISTVNWLVGRGTNLSNRAFFHLDDSERFIVILVGVVCHAGVSLCLVERDCVE